jgi:GH25 family lysozyme M1 (1,4-beta-N-acetylmuramidase)
MNILNRQYWENNRKYGESRHVLDSLFVFQSDLVMPDASKVFGIDVSHWNPPPVDFKRMKDFDLRFVIIKGCDGSINSRYYEENKAAVKAAGLPWGMYVWLYPNNKVSIDSQVSAWYARYKSDPPPMGVFIDCEWTTYGGVAANPTSVDLRMAHDKWKAKSGEKATTYTAAGYANEFLKSFDWSKEDLWVANYGVSKPALPIGAKTYIIHQFTSTLDGKALDPKGNAELDGNYYNGTLSEFNARYGISDEPEEPEGEDEMTAEQWNQLIAKLDEILAAVKSVSVDGGDDEPPVPPTDDYRTTYKVLDVSKTPGNHLTVVYKSPDTNETNTEQIYVGTNYVTVYDRWQDVPGHPVWSSFSDIDKERTYVAKDGWRAIDCTLTNKMVNANGLPYAFPAKIRYNQEPRIPKVVWIRKSDLGL